MSNPNHLPEPKLSANEWRAIAFTEGEADRRFAVEHGDDDAVMPDCLSGEHAGESIPEIFGCWPSDEILDAYEEGYAEGWEAAAL